MSKNLDQVYIANPITSNASTDLMYFMQSPYTAGTDAAMTYANFSAQFGAPYTAAALTKTDDTNVTLTLGGTPSTSLLHATSLTLGWTGQLGVARGGTAAASFTAYSVICGGTTSTGALQSVASVGTSGQVLTSNGASALPTFQTVSAGVTASQVQNQSFSSAVDAGSANAYAITLSPAVTSYAEGQLFTFRAANNNTTASTLAVNGLAAKAIYVAGTNALVGGEIIGGSTYLVEYNGAAGGFFLINPSILIPSQASQIQNQAFTYAVDSGAANAYVVTLSPALGAYVDGQIVSFRAANANSGATTIAVNGLAAKAIVTNANGALIGGEILLHGSYNVEYNSSFGKFVLLNSSASGGGGGGAIKTNVQTFSANGSQTYTPTANLLWCTVEMVAEGGGGGGAVGAANSYGGAAAGGDYVRKNYTSANIGASAAIVLSVGNAVGGSGNSAGTNGGNSTFTPAGTGSVITAHGGLAGGSPSGGTKPGSTGSTGSSTGDVIIQSSQGMDSYQVDATSGGLLKAVVGSGGNSFLGQGAQSQIIGYALTGTENIAGNNAVQGYGGGGGGAFTNGASSTAQTGGTGGGGYCIVTEYLSM